MRVVWLTDIHLNFIGHDRIEAFCRDICAVRPNAILISGDIGEAANVDGYLQRLEASLQMPIYFVLGNHDYYGSSLTVVRFACGYEPTSKPSLLVAVCRCC